MAALLLLAPFYLRRSSFYVIAHSLLGVFTVRWPSIARIGPAARTVPY
jgi:hypothetical protein